MVMCRAVLIKGLKKTTANQETTTEDRAKPETTEIINQHQITCTKCVLVVLVLVAPVPMGSEKSPGGGRGTTWERKTQQAQTRGIRHHLLPLLKGSKLLLVDDNRTAPALVPISAKVIRSCGLARGDKETDASLLLLLLHQLIFRAIFYIPADF